MAETPRDVPDSQLVTARQWQRTTHGPAVLDWMRSSGVAQQMLADICAAAETMARWLTRDDPEQARDTAKS